MLGMENLINRGLKYGDYCTVIPAGGSRKKLRLNRTSWNIVPEGDNGGGHPTIQIPGMKPNSFKLRLELTPLENGESRFLLKSMDGKPFALNGQWGKEVFVESRDTLCADGPGRIEFSSYRPQNDFKIPQTPWILEDQAILNSNISILLQGETGTGKGYLAREIHQQSGRTGSFVAINIQAFASGLVESELFGHKKGAFTGAIRDKMGAISQAKYGTLFIDEIDSLSKDLQTKLLLFLDDLTYQPVGGEKSEKANVRLIFASGQDLSTLVGKGVIRSDFYYRLKQGIAFELKPLRERTEDIGRHCELFCINENVSLSERLTQFYTSLPWPGNVRQLRGHLQTKKIMSKTRKLDFDDCDEALMTMSSSLMGLALQTGPIRPIDEVKKDYAAWAMEKGQFELGWTAKQLRVNPKTLKQWLS